MENLVLHGLEPAAVFYWFEQFTAIPHGSTNTKKISDFCVAFAHERSLRVRQDAANNVIIWKDGTAGYENHPPVMLQGHIDMVCAKDPDCDLDLQRDALRLCVDGDKVYAQGTTLGGDNGIAAAYALAILDANDIPHPPLEVVLTTDEEIGMLGAAELDCSDLKSRILLNIDSEEEGVLTVGCAGGMRCTIALPYLTAPARGQLYRLSISGLCGGHSGVEIDKGRANANKLLGETLRLLSEACPIRIASIAGGSQDNAIPNLAHALIVAPGEQASLLAAVCEEFAKEMRGIYSSAEPNLSITCTLDNSGVTEVWDEESTRRVIRALNEVPNGIQTMSRDIEGLVQTSLNLGIVEQAGDSVKLTFALRSSVDSEKAYLCAVLRGIAESYGALFFTQGDYPAWEYRKDSPLRDTMLAVYEAQYGTSPEVVTIHAGLECGLLGAKLPGLDSVSFGPNLSEIHTTRESLSVASVERTWRYLLGILAHL